MVIARNQDTGVSGVFPVTALMGRTAPSVLWLNLEGPDGTVSRLGVTSEHPMRAFQGDWVDAGDLVVGDRIEDGNARAITVLSVELDNTPQIVGNRVV